MDRATKKYQRVVGLSIVVALLAVALLVVHFVPNEVSFTAQKTDYVETGDKYNDGEGYQVVHTTDGRTFKLADNDKLRGTTFVKGHRFYCKRVGVWRVLGEPILIDCVDRDYGKQE